MQYALKQNANSVDRDMKVSICATSVRFGKYNVIGQSGLRQASDLRLDHKPYYATIRNSNDIVSSKSL